MNGIIPRVIVLLVLGVRARAQQSTAPVTGPVVTIQQLFTAMALGDSAAARRMFAPSARVVPMRAGTQSPLTVDQFVGFVATLQPGSWKERIWQPRVESSETLADVWFEYDVVRGASVSQCGWQSVQLTQSPDGWRIISMAFTNSTEKCQRPAS
jgi:hypothetical protein